MHTYYVIGAYEGGGNSGGNSGDCDKGKQKKKNKNKKKCNAIIAMQRQVVMSCYQKEVQKMSATVSSPMLVGPSHVGPLKHLPEARRAHRCITSGPTHVGAAAIALVALALVLWW